MGHAFFDLPHPLVLGHRGAAGHAPENTLNGFERGLALGAQVIETDVQVSREGVPILLHDSAVDRTTNGSGESAELSLAEIKALDAGHHFSPDDTAHPARGQGIEIPTLEEAFEAFPRAHFNIELKSPRPGLSEAVVELVGRFDRADRTLLTAGEDDIMADLRRVLKQSDALPAVGASISDIAAVARAAQSGEPPPRDAMALQIPEGFAGRPLVTSEFLTHAHRYGIEVHVWTINEPEAIDRLLRLGADGIVSDYPDRVRAWAEENRAPR